MGGYNSTENQLLLALHLPFFGRMWINSPLELEQLEGVGPKHAQYLRDAGILSLAQVDETAAPQIEGVRTGIGNIASVR